jgi:hypothetical protein
MGMCCHAIPILHSRFFLADHRASLAIGWWLDHKPERYEVVDFQTPHSGGKVLIDHSTNEITSLDYKYVTPVPEPSTFVLLAIGLVFACVAYVDDFLGRTKSVWATHRFWAKPACVHFSTTTLDMTCIHMYN